MTVLMMLLKGNEEFTNKQAEFYNQEINRIENVNEINLFELEAKVIRLENEIKK